MTDKNFEGGRTLNEVEADSRSEIIEFLESKMKSRLADGRPEFKDRGELARDSERYISEAVSFKREVLDYHRAITLVAELGHNYRDYDKETGGMDFAPKVGAMIRLHLESVMRKAWEEWRDSGEN